MKTIIIALVAIISLGFISSSSHAQNAQSTETNQSFQVEIIINPELINNPNVRIYQANESRSMRDYIYPALTSGQLQGADYTLINTVSEWYEIFHEEGEIDLVTVKKMKGILDSMKCKPVGDNYDFGKIDNSARFLIYKDNSLFLSEKGKVRKMKNKEILDPFGNDYDMRIMIAKD